MEDKPKTLNKKAQLSFMKLVGTALLILLFAVSMVNFGFILSNDNNSTHSITTDPSLVKINATFSEELQDSTTSLNNSASGFFGDIPIIGTVEATIGAIFGTIPSMVSITSSSFTLVMGVIRDTLGIPPIVLYMGSAFILLALVLLAWRVYKAGQ